MDQDRFDQLAVAVANGSSRRALLRRLGVTSLIALLGLLGFAHDPNADAGRRGKHRQRRRKDRRDTHHDARQNKRASKDRQSLGAQATTCGKRGKACCAPGDSCGSKLICLDGVCRRPSHGNCLSGQAKCGGRCVDLGTDTDCAGCGNACAAPERCLDGTCGLAPRCDDSLRNGDETDVDCGGSCGATCANGQTCGDDGDCASGFCQSGACAPAPPCRDGIQNGDETDVDCGGGSCPRCGDGKKCRSFTDCAGHRCLGGICQSWPICPAGQEYCTAPNHLTECGPGCACATSLDTGVTVCGANSLRQCFGCTTDEECTIRLGLVGFPNMPGICARDIECSCPGSTVCLPASCGCGSDGSLCS